MTNDSPYPNFDTDERGDVPTEVPSDADEFRYAANVLRGNVTEPVDTEKCERVANVLDTIATQYDATFGGK